MILVKLLKSYNFLIEFGKYYDYYYTYFISFTPITIRSLIDLSGPIWFEYKHYILKHSLVSFLK